MLAPIARSTTSEALLRLPSVLAALGLVAVAWGIGRDLGGPALAWRAGHQRWLAPFVPIGRMALTNYLTQTAIGIALFYGVGLGWMGRVGPAQWMLLWVGIVAVQAALSAAWLRSHAQGPAEWAWRRFTYGGGGTPAIG